MADDDSENIQADKSHLVDESDPILTEKFNSLDITDNKLEIIVDGNSISCSKILLTNNCEYFKAFDHFNCEKSDRIEIKGGLEFDTLKMIIDFFKSGELDIDLSNFQSVLEACMFLQCGKAEEIVVNFVAHHLGRENVFSIYFFALSIGSKRLANVCKFYLEKVFAQVLLNFSQCGKLDPFLNCSIRKLEELLNSDLQCSEELLFFAVLGWIQNKPQRKCHTQDLLSKINFFLFSSSALSCLEIDTDLADEEIIKNSVQDAAKYKTLRLDLQVEFWNNKFELQLRRWPKVIVASPTGNFQGGLQYLDLNKPCPAWKNLTKKPAELRKRSTGSTMVYFHPKLYFLGGEQHWQLNWYNLETNKWGVESGMPPGRLLSGASVVGTKLYLVGGVSIEDWDGLKGGTGQVVTSPGLDCFCLETKRWEQLMEMDVSRSSPGVAVVGGQILVFGGLKRREMLQSCYIYDPCSDSWDSLPEMPEKFAYFSCLAVNKDVWLMGGMGQDYKCRTQTYMFNTEDRIWRVGPSLNQPRKGAFSFYHNGNIYLCGGSMDGMKYLDTTEIFDRKLEGERWRMEKIGLKNWNCGVVCVSVRQPIRFLNNNR